jgi:hypothetical protein
MRTLAIACLVAACSSSSKSPDAQPHDSSNPGTTCSAYCMTLQAACTGANGQFMSMQTCTSSCMNYPLGNAGDQSGNSLACRAYHAMLAQTDPVTHCVHAGPSGGGACGNPCDGFCSLVVKECATQYPSASACATTCAGFAATPAYTDNVQTGNSLSCRIYAATLASTMPAAHCADTGSASTTCQ